MLAEGIGGVARPDHLPPVDGGEERGVEAERTSSAYLVHSAGHTEFHYEVGRVILSDEASTSAIVLIAEQDNNTFCAIPFEVWHRRVSSRLFISRGLIRPILCSVSACHPEAREEPEEMLQLKVWIGILSQEAFDRVEFGAEDLPDYPFTGPGLEDGFLPYAPSLVEVIQEKFAFMSAESGGPEVGGGGDDVSGRLSRLEDGLSEIRLFLKELAKGPQKSAGASSPKEPAVGETSASPSKRPGALKRKEERRVTFEGLDPSVTDAALRAGIPEGHLRELSGLLKQRPGRMEDLPRPSVKKTDPLSDSGEEEEEALEEGEAGSHAGSSSDGGVAKAIVKLTKLCSHLTDKKARKKGDQLEHLLDLGHGGEGGGEGFGSGGQKKAAALRLLRKQLAENPRLILESIESNLCSDFAARPVRPGEPRSGATARGWLEARSRVQNYTGHVRWCWQIAGIWDCLMADQVEQARARCALLLSAADQASVDSGSWLLAQQVLLEGPPPYHSFSSHQAPSVHERHHTALLDTRWLDLFLHHIRELDSYQEAKRRLGGRAGRGDDKDKEVEKFPKNPKPKAKGSPKGKGKSASSSAAEEKEASS